MYKPKINSSFNIEDFSLDQSLLKITLPGDLITDEEGYMKYFPTNSAATAHTQLMARYTHQFWATLPKPIN